MALEAVPADIAYRLRPAEEVLWWGRSRRARIRGLTDPALLPVAAVVAAVATAMIVVPRHWQPSVAVIFRWAIGCSALSLVVTWLTMVLRQRRLRGYAITRDRVLVVSAGAGGTHAVALESLSGLRVDARQDGTGTIWFSEGTGPARPRFEEVGDVRAVFETLRQAKAARQARLA